LNGLRYLPNPVVKTYSTPRRLAVYVPALYTKQPSLTSEIVGPSVKVAFDKEGKPTRAAESFAAKYSVRIADLRRVTNPKGEYLAVEHYQTGRSAFEVLREVVPELLGRISFPKSMYWTSKAGPFFVRPIRWILALLGEGGEARIVPLEFAGVPSGNLTYGHRLKGYEAVQVSGFKEYMSFLESRWVLVDPDRRRERASGKCKALLEAKNLVRINDEALEEWVVKSTEWPEPLLGSFDRGHLELPREILITVMRDHQKYFAVEDRAGNLQPQFVTVLNVPGDAEGLIRQGHERVLAARFADAEFFWKTDMQRSLDERREILERVTYHERLGSYGDKVRRMNYLAGALSDAASAAKINDDLKQRIGRAVELCKCDLTTQMVQEFTELQGVVGGLYAAAQGEDPVVAEAIYDHYQPQNSESPCPRSIVGSIVSLTDKLDSVLAGFAVGLEPSGSSDPFGLRRAGNAVVKLSVEALPGVDLCAVAGVALGQIQRSLSGPQEGAWPKLVNFFRERLEFYLRDVLGLGYDTARSVLAPTIRDGWNVPLRVAQRAQALEHVRATPDYVALAAAAKRTRNILAKSVTANDETESEGMTEAKLIEEPERELYRSYQRLVEHLDRFENDGDYEGALQEIATIRPAVDVFFDKVLVMSEDPDVRSNRIHLLTRLNTDVFSRFADLSELAPQARGGGAAKFGETAPAEKPGIGLAPRC
ncbi:MAG: glycine--tRNA ligase subunit beta, partial [Terriglobia bacterium]